MGRLGHQFLSQLRFPGCLIIFKTVSRDMAGVTSYLLSAAHDENPSINSTEITWRVIGTLHSFGFAVLLMRGLTAFCMAFPSRSGRSTDARVCP
jgi:hypothetical protein